MEKAPNVSGIPAGDFGWNDVGSWNAVYELLARDGHGNVIIHDSVCLDSHNNFVDAPGKVVALIGVRDLIVVDTPDALLVVSARPRPVRRRDPQDPGKTRPPRSAVTIAPKPLTSAQSPVNVTNRRSAGC